MDRWTVLRRGLIHHWRTNLAVVLAVAVATSALAGALIVGDSVRGSLRAITLERLGKVDLALAGPRLLRTKLAEEIRADLPSGGQIWAVLRVRGAMIDVESQRRVSGLTVYAVQDDFWDIAPGGPHRHPGPREVVLNHAVAAELEVRPGDWVLLLGGKLSEIPRDLLLGQRRRSDTVEEVRLQVAAVISDRRIGRFSLEPNQQVPRNAYVSLSALGRRLSRSGRINCLLFSQEATAGGRARAGAAELDSLLRSHLDLSDFGLKLIVDEPRRLVQLESESMILEPAAAEVAVAVARRRYPSTAKLILTHLANAIRVGDRQIPYSTISAIGPVVPAETRPRSGAAGEGPASRAIDSIVLNTWAAEDLRAKPGDEVEVTYFAPETRQGHAVQDTHRFRLAGTVAIDQPGGDRLLTPQYPGVTDAERISEWHPPFPFDPKRIRPIDEEYWNKYRATPKAFVDLATGQRLWAGRYGKLTAVRISVPPGSEVQSVAKEFRAALLEKLDPAAFGLVFRPVKQEGLRASIGNTNFGEYFFYFSFFLIVSAVMLVGMLFRLGVEQRASQIGLLLATGWRVASVRGLLLGEAAVLAGTGAVLGAGGGTLYAWLILSGLTHWYAVIGPSDLRLFVGTASVVMGALAGFVAGLGSIFLAVRHIVRTSPRALLAGQVVADISSREKRRGRRRWFVCGGLLVLALGIVAASQPNGPIPEAIAFFGGGSLLLAAALTAMSALLAGVPRTVPLRGAWAYFRLAWRNAARNPTRSVLTVGLVASALFVIVSVEAFRQAAPSNPFARDSGTGGFSLMARSDVPLAYNPSDPAAYEALGIDEQAATALAGVRIIPLRLRQGDEASCLNLYKPASPRIVGVPPELVRRGGFRFSAGGGRDNPWTLLEQKIPVTGQDKLVIPTLADAGTTQYILHLSVGQELPITDQRGRTVRLRIVGTLDRSIFQSELLISGEYFRELFPRQDGYSLFLIEAPPNRVSAAAANLERCLGDYFGFDVMPTVERLAGYAQVENTYLSTFQALGAVGLLLGTLGLAAVLLRNILQRRAELALLRAVGFRKAALGFLVLAETGLLLVCGLLVGTGAAFVAVIPHLAERAHLPIAALALVPVAVLFAGIGAGGLAVASALRTPLLPALRAE